MYDSERPWARTCGVTRGGRAPQLAVKSCELRRHAHATYLVHRGSRAGLTRLLTARGGPCDRLRRHHHVLSTEGRAVNTGCQSRLSTGCGTEPAGGEEHAAEHAADVPAKEAGTTIEPGQTKERALPRMTAVRGAGCALSGPALAGCCGTDGGRAAKAACGGRHAWGCGDSCHRGRCRPQTSAPQTRRCPLRPRWAAALVRELAREGRCSRRPRSARAWAWADR